MSKRYIKEDIRNTARRLFNERGYANVSMRDIAEVLGISVGNLTYHYRLKEELLEAVVLEIRKYYEPPAPPQTLPQLNAHFAQLQNTIQQNAFYFWHYAQLGQLSEAVREMQTQIIEAEYALLSESFAILAKNGLLKGEAYPSQYTQIVQNILLVCIYWTPHAQLEAQLSCAPCDFLSCVWSALLPMLSDKGIEAYRSTVQQVRIEFD